jgi:cobalt-zinc-cadmium efflux system outer membrane protein
MRAPFARFARHLALIVSALGAGVPAMAQPAAGAATPVSRLSAADAVTLALAHNHAMRAQRFDIDQARADETTAGLKPNLTFYSDNEGFPVFNPSQASWENFVNNQSFAQGVSYLFERGGKRKQRLAVALDTTDVVGKTVTDAERQLRLSVMQAFIDVLLAKSNLELAQENLKDFSAVVTVNQQRLAAGDISEGDYLKIALEKLQFEQDVSAARVALVQGRAALRQLVGYEMVTADFDVEGELTHRAHVVSLEDLQQQALAARPDLLAAQSGIKLANDAAALAVSNRALDLTGNVEYERNGPQNAMGFGLSIDIPIHNRNQGEIARTRVAVEQAGEAATAAQQAVLTDVATAYAGLQTADEVVSLYESGYLEQATESRDISRYAYQRGAANLLDLLDAERTYRDTEFAYRQALASFMLNVAQINYAVGKQVLP